MHSYVLAIFRYILTHFLPICLGIREGRLLNLSLQEKTERGTRLFPFQLYRMNPMSRAGFIAHHWHKEIEILHALEGEFVLTSGQNSYLAQPSQIFFINTEQLHSIQPTAFPCRYDAFVFPLDLLCFEMQDYVQTYYLNPLYQKETVLPALLSQEKPFYNDIRRELIRISNSEKGNVCQDPFTIKLALLNIIQFLAVSGQIQNADTRSTGYRQSDLQKEILLYLSDHMHERLSLPDVSSQFGFSPKYFSRFFKKSFDKTFIQYVNDLRIKKACELLHNSNQSVMEISLNVGFKNLSYFIRQFKSATGRTPSQYRKAQPFCPL